MATEVGSGPAAAATRPCRERVVIAVLTFRRRRDLAELLPMLVDQAVSARTLCAGVDIVVVDNDAEATGRDIVMTAAEAAQGRGVDVRYEHEPRPGISAGRNRALDASDGSELMVFIDDDERPTPTWLTLLLSTRRQYRADVVQGPVVSRFETPLDSWIVAGGFFRRRRMVTGTPLDVAVTNNLLIDLRRVRTLGLRFDEDLGTTGGEDTLFTRALHRAGVAMVWCDEAIVFDVVPAHRSTRRWVTQRAVSMGNSAALVALKLSPDHSGRRATTRVRLAAAGGIRLVGGSCRALLGTLLRSETLQARGVRTVLRGLGMTIGAMGYAYHEYGRAGGRRITKAFDGSGRPVSGTRPAADGACEAGVGHVR